MRTIGRRLATTLLGLALALDASALKAQEPQPPIMVWAIPASKVYHCPGSTWYGKTKDGSKIEECEAIRQGYRPAFGRGCGSTCPGGTVLTHKRPSLIRRP